MTESVRTLMESVRILMESMRILMESVRNLVETKVLPFSFSSVVLCFLFCLELLHLHFPPLVVVVSSHLAPLGVLCCAALKFAVDDSKNL